MTPDNVIRSWFDEVWTQGKEDSIDRLFALDGLAHGLAGGSIDGPAAFKPFFRTFRQTFPDIKVAVLRTVTEGDYATAHCHVTGTHHGHDLGIKATGNPIEFSGMCIVRVRDGQIVEAWNTFDFLTLYQQIGMLPRIPA